MGDHYERLKLLWVFIHIVDYVKRWCHRCSLNRSSCDEHSKMVWEARIAHSLNQSIGPLWIMTRLPLTIAKFDLFFIVLLCRPGSTAYKPLPIKDLLGKYGINVTKQEVVTLERYVSRNKDKFANVYALLKSYSRLLHSKTRTLSILQLSHFL